MGHLNGIFARVGGNLNNNFQKSQMPGGLPGGGMLKLRFDRYITLSFRLVLGLSLHAIYYAKNETSEQSLYMFLDARPFGSLQAFKLCFCLEDPQD